MPFRALPGALLVFLAVSSPAAGGGQWEAWRSIFADFFFGPEVKQEFRWRGRVAKGATLEIKGVNGGVRAEPAAGDEAQVLALKRGRRRDPAQVEIRVVEHEGGTTLCAVYPSPDPATPNECRPVEKGRMNVRNNDVSVEFTVRVPREVSFVARTVNGSVEAAGLSGNVEAHTVNGSVKVSTDGHARARTVNGSITAAVGRADWTEPVAFRTVNGAISLTLPRESSASLQAETVNGSIATDFPLTGVTRLGRRELSGTIGSGGRKLALATVNGSIRLSRGP